MDITAWIAAMADNATGWGDEMRAMITAFNGVIETLQGQVADLQDQLEDATAAATAAVTTANNAAPKAGSIQFSDDPAVRTGGTDTAHRVFYFTTTEPTSKQNRDIWVVQ